MAAISATALASQPTKRLSDADRGKELYNRHCVACHGSSGGGDGPATAQLVFDVPDLTAGVKLNEDMVNVVLRGRATMPGFENAFDKFDARRALRHMNQLSGATSSEEEPMEEPEQDSEPEGGDAPPDGAPVEDVIP